MARIVSLIALPIMVPLALGLSSCDSKPNRETAQAIGQLAARVDRLEAQQRELESHVTELRASASKWTLWRQAFRGDLAAMPIAEDAFPEKADCLASARARLLKAGAQMVTQDPLSGSFGDRTDRMYCLPNGVRSIGSITAIFIRASPGCYCSDCSDWPPGQRSESCSWP